LRADFSFSSFTKPFDCSGKPFREMFFQTTFELQNLIGFRFLHGRVRFIFNKPQTDNKLVFEKAHLNVHTSASELLQKSLSLSRSPAPAKHISKLTLVSLEGNK
jgi:hypothetical protein